jgi:hypothetical protein
MPTLTLQPASGIDTYIEQGNPTTNRGAVTSETVGLLAGNIYRGLIKFDLSSVDPSWIIVSATLNLTWNSESDTADRTFTIHRSLVEWFETGSTWNLRNTSGSVAWIGGAGGASGSDWSSTATDSVVVVNMIEYPFDVTNDVRDFIAGTQTNHGWWIRGEEAAANSTKSFITSDSGTAADRPELVIEYLDPGVAIVATKDAYINQNTSGNNWGVATTVNIGEDSGDSDRVGFLQFDLSTIPANATILSATMQLVWDTIQNTSQVMSWHRLLVDWTEGTANGTAGTVNWNNRTSGVPWNTAGARGSGTDRESSASFTIAATSLVAGVRTDHDVTTDVQVWYAGTPNFGWTVDFTFLTGSNNQVTFRSSDHATAADRPRLLVEYILQNLEGSLAGTSTATAVIYASGYMAGTANGTSTSAANLTTNEYMRSEVEGFADVMGEIFAAGYLRGISAGTSSVSGDIIGLIHVYGSSAGSATSIGNIQGQFYMEGLAEGTATVSATGSFEGQGRGSIAGTSEVTGLMWGKATGVARIIGCNPTPLLYITDGSIKNNGQLNILNFLSEGSGFKLQSWRPQIAQYKEGGRFSNGPLAQGRRLRYRNFDNAIEVFELAATSRDQDDLIIFQQELLAWQEAAANYWVADFSLNPVYLVAKAARETNPRYAIIHMISVPELENPYQQPFYNIGHATFTAITPRIERGHWLSTPPGQFECVQISSQRSWTVSGWETGA